VVYPVLSRTMLLLSSAATAAADFDQHYELQSTATAAVGSAYARSASAVAAAQDFAGSAVTSVREAAVAASHYARVPDVVAAAQASIASAEEQVTALLDASPEGSMVGSARDALRAAALQLAAVREAWTEGRVPGLAEASRAAITRAREAVSALSTPAVGALGGAVDAGVTAARVRADAALRAAQEHVSMARARLVPAAEEAAELSSEGMRRLGQAAFVLAEAGEDVAVRLAASADEATGLSDRVSAVVASLQLQSAGEAVAGAVGTAARSPAVTDAVARLEAADEASCCGCGSRTARVAWTVATAAWAYAVHLAGRVAKERATAKETSTTGSSAKDGSAKDTAAGAKKRSPPKAKNSDSEAEVVAAAPAAAEDSGSRPASRRRSRAPGAPRMPASSTRGKSK